MNVGRFLGLLLLLCLSGTLARWLVTAIFVCHRFFLLVTAGDFALLLVPQVLMCFCAALSGAFARSAFALSFGDRR